MKKCCAFLLLLVLIVFGILLGGVGYFEFMPPTCTCASCHEIVPSERHWLMSAHRTVDCHACHGSSMGSLGDNAKRVWRHITQTRHDDIRLSEKQIIDMTAACGKCHAKEYADWKASGHGKDYGAFFTNTVHNAAYKPADDCLRCHGMFFKGECNDLLEEVYTTGKTSERAPAYGTMWRFREPERAATPAIPCLACHEVHAANVTTNAFYWRGSRQHLAVNDRCVQCHSPDASGKPGTADDKTVTGVHAGYGCTVCHKGHSLDARSSCHDCHAKPMPYKGDVHRIEKKR
jgi:hypothetical protein